MTDKEKLIKIKSLADKMYDAAFNITTDASLLRKAMDDYHQFLIYEYHKEEPVSEELNTAAKVYSDNITDKIGYKLQLRRAVVYGAKWQKEQFEKDYTDLCNGIATAKGIAVAMAYDKGIADAKEQMMAKAVEAIVHVDAGGYPYIPQMELYDYDNDVPLAKEGDKYKVVLIKAK